MASDIIKCTLSWPRREANSTCSLYVLSESSLAEILPTVKKLKNNNWDSHHDEDHEFCKLQDTLERSSLGFVRDTGDAGAFVFDFSPYSTAGVIKMELPIRRTKRKKPNIYHWSGYLKTETTLLSDIHVQPEVMAQDCLRTLQSEVRRLDLCPSARSWLMSTSGSTLLEI
eukprot:TRINITY_DN11243_c0_g1_i5.p1 TRINITY_DN11243_c0_g1~~TRINITY_DN11243_c0_g1_i5.p1  ORF type:complete len:170 (+),score=4.85 TRINITY_DN11243_c0_g1_i5:554-1063(+)